MRDISRKEKQTGSFPLSMIKFIAGIVVQVVKVKGDLIKPGKNMKAETVFKF